jgi:cell division protease FtsH
LFSTEVPTFWNDNQLTALLQAHGVQVNATSTTQGTPLLASLLLGFGPTLLIVGVVVLFMRRAARAGAGGALGNFGRSKARRVVTRRRSGLHLPTSPASTRPRES